MLLVNNPSTDGCIRYFGEKTEHTLFTFMLVFESIITVQLLELEC